MMKNILKVGMLVGALLPCWGAGEVQALPAPGVTGGMPLMEAIAKRQSARDFDAGRAIDDQTLSEILWVAWGMNARGKRTIPTSRGLQNMQLFVLTPTGTWEYDGMAHKLTRINDKNLIPLCERQDFVKNAPPSTQSFSIFFSISGIISTTVSSARKKSTRVPKFEYGAR